MVRIMCPYSTTFTAHQVLTQYSKLQPPDKDLISILQVLRAGHSKTMSKAFQLFDIPFYSFPKHRMQAFFLVCANNLIIQQLSLASNPLLKTARN